MMYLSKQIKQAGFVALILTGSHAGAPAAEPEYQSIFKHYQPWVDEPIQDWCAVNDNVARIGGWRTYAKEIQAEEVKP